jgi:hypothetical protein
MVEKECVEKCGQQPLRLTGIRAAHKVVAAVADSEVVELLKGDATLAFANVARDGVVYRAVRDQQGALLTFALAIDFDTDDGENQLFISTRVRCKHLLKFGVAVNAHVVMLTHARKPCRRHDRTRTCACIAHVALSLSFQWRCCDQMCCHEEPNTAAERMRPWRRRNTWCSGTQKRQNHRGGSYVL